jgi:eukaryotic-like serine/threonine-protein kinase
VGLVLLQWQQRIPASVLDWVVLAGFNLLVLFVYFGVTESMWAASPGKAIVGLRVVSVASGPLRVAQCLIRASLWAIPPLAGIVATVLYMPRALPGVATSAGLVGYVGGHAGNLAGIALFFATARRRNGFAGLHDLVSGTRVVCAPAVEGASSTSRRADTRARPSSVGARVGPYRLLDEPALPGITVGLDEQLDRRVWIRRSMHARTALAVIPGRQVSSQRAQPATRRRRPDPGARTWVGTRPICSVRPSACLQRTRETWARFPD